MYLLLVILLVLLLLGVPAYRARPAYGDAPGLVLIVVIVIVLVLLLARPGWVVWP